ncbi:hypothetical protein F949_01010 [Acinetobacter junii NIPH 182]|uniref:hypothetical protein n=1 Tax=Acinetobacter junii TaxID=40215 RepID=UPI0002CDE514|nr:hypothetical protein [Acinetobacter junii]ENV63635.1 hypothetical protein F949_01010 [Acinetobacter junii NIPH 182]
MTWYLFLEKVISVIANLFTIFASGIAIWLFLSKSKEIKLAFKLMLNWSFQLTLTDLKSKVERLNEYNANNSDEIEEIRNILHEIAGQMRGNSQLNQQAPELIMKIERFSSGNRITEYKKRALTSEIREILRNLEINSLTSNLE